jgi:hypothetical protein
MRIVKVFSFCSTNIKFLENLNNLTIAAEISRNKQSFKADNINVPV